MQDLISKADALLEALPYLQRFRGATFVIKYGGSFMDSPGAPASTAVARDVVFLAAAGIGPVLAHGGGKAITAALARAGLAVRFIQGMRVTDEAAVQVVERVLSQEINPQIVNTINRLGGRARGFSGTEIFTCRKLWLAGSDGERLDPGLVGEVVAVQGGAVAGLRPQWSYPGGQPDGARPGRADLQLQRGRGGGAGGHRLESRTAGFYERRPRGVARSKESRLAYPAPRGGRGGGFEKIRRD